MQKVVSGIFHSISLSTLCIVFCIFYQVTIATAQPFQYSRKIAWNPAHTGVLPSGDSAMILNFKGAASFPSRFGYLPVYIESFRLFTANDSIAVLRIDQPVYEKTGISGIRDQERITAEPVIRYSVTSQKKQPYLNVSIIPLRKDAEGNTEKLVSFTLTMEIIPGGSKMTEKSVRTYAASSVLAAGKWFKLAINSTGVYKLSQSDLVALDPGFASADPRTIRVYGNGGGMLPENVSIPRIDDLRELSIRVVGEDDGKLDASDYLLFYGEGPDKWSFNSTDQLFHHSKNIYSDNTCYFITYGQAGGKRITPLASTNQTATDHVNRFNDYSFYEKDEINLIKSGRQWYDGSIFELTTVRDYSFSFADIDISNPVTLRAAVAAHSTKTSTSFVISANGQNVMNIPIVPTSTADNSAWGSEKIADATFSLSGSPINLRISFQKNGQEAIGCLNYLEINVMRMLKMSGGQMNFRSVAGFGSGKVTDFTATGTGSPMAIWDVTDPGNTREVQALNVGNDYNFRLPSDTLREFIAYDGTAFKTILSSAAVENQNLHGLGSYDYLIITHPSFMNEANDLANFHATQDHLAVLVTTPEKIYNEFSSGVQDITAIRDFAKMIYDRAPSGREPRYMLLIGDASYDYKNRKANNTNFVPAIQSFESLNPLSTYATDDYYGMMESYDSLQIGVGRFPVRTAGEAKAAVAKVKHYVSISDSVKNEWRNVVCFVADDEDGNLHMEQTESISSIVQQGHPVYNIDKVYLDAYPQISTPGGARIPDVNAALNLRVEKGALIMNYTGHGGKNGWAHERVLEIPDIRNWKNFDKMPVFVTATCEFTLYDDPDWVSAGEWVFLNPTGGGIALFTTTRPTFASDNVSLTANFYSHAFNKTNGVYPSLGDLIVISKNASGNDLGTRKFILIGDPAIKMAYPALNVVTTSINGQPVGAIPDTISALETITIAGEIRDLDGNPATDFNGTVFPTVFDKVSEITTLAFDGGTPFNFSLRKNIIYKGKVDVTNGTFSFSFIVPKDIAYQYGVGKISYYARSSSTDANGYDPNLIVGGYNNNSSTDVNGPLVRLFMNDTTFVSGGLTDQNPKMLAILSDQSGINTVGNGIGHDLTVTLDNDSKNQDIVNDYYVSDANTFKSGNILYPFFKLSDGLHTLKLKVWDVYNNSSDAYLEFVVASSAELALDHLFNYPNPLIDHTTFSFEYNKPNSNLDVSISIYSLSGQLVKKIDANLFTNGYRANTITWDGTSDRGYKISSGNYIYNVRVSSPDGATVYKSAKLVVIR